MTVTIVRRSSRAVVALALIALVAALPRPGQASHVAFQLVRTTVDTGWANTAIGATYNHALRAGAGGTTVSLTDRLGASVSGATALKGSAHESVPDSVVFTPASALTEGGGPYTLTINAVADEDGSTLSTVRTFKIDLLKPLTPALANVDAIVQGTPPTISGAGSDDVRATDTAGAFRSGVNRVELQYFRLEPSGTPQAPGIPSNVPIPPTVPGLGTTLSRHHFTFDATLAPCAVDNTSCTNAAGQVVHEKAFSFAPTALAPGLWTVKAYVVDKAGNRSNGSEVTFLYVG